MPVNNNGTHRVLTANGGSSVDAESNLTFNGTTMTLNGNLEIKTYKIEENTNGDLEFKLA